MNLEILEEFKPRYQFIHDLLEGVSVNHHNKKNPHEKFRAYLRGYASVEQELKDTQDILKQYLRRGTQTVVVDSNHDNWLGRWLREEDFRNMEMVNAELYLDMQAEMLRNIRKEQEQGVTTPTMTEYAMKKYGCSDEVRFLHADESFPICHKKIECGMHGHLGPDGASGTPDNLKKMGRDANTAHTHAAEIRSGLYVAGTSTVLRMGYNHGPSSWTHSHIFTYPNGKRTIITVFAGKWRA